MSENDQVYVLRWSSETLGVFGSLESAQHFVQRRAGDMVWKHHDSHGRWWEAAFNGLVYVVEEVPLYV